MKENNNEVATLVPVIGFRKFMTGYFNDYQELVELIDNKTLRYSDIYTIVQKYNMWYESPK